MTLTEALARLHAAGKPSWLPWMLDTQGDRIRSVESDGRIECYGDEPGKGCPPSGMWPPDLADPATRGALLDIAREAWGEPAAYASTESTESDGADWGVFTSGDAIIVHRMPTEGDAIAAAIIAAAEALEAP